MSERTRPIRDATPSTSKSLFRAEALLHQQDRLLGDAVTFAPLPRLASILIIVSFAIAIYVAGTATYRPSISAEVMDLGVPHRVSRLALRIQSVPTSTMQPGDDVFVAYASHEVGYKVDAVSKLQDTVLVYLHPQPGPSSVVLPPANSQVVVRLPPRQLLRAILPY